MCLRGFDGNTTYIEGAERNLFTVGMPMGVCAFLMGMMVSIVVRMSMIVLSLPLSIVSVAFVLMTMVAASYDEATSCN